MRKKSILLFVLSFIILLSGCGNSAKPETTVSKMCDALKTFDAETVSSCFVSEGEGIGNFEEIANDEQKDILTEQVTEYMKSCAGKMTYAIEESKTEEDSAVVSVSFTHVDASPIISSALGEYVSQGLALALSGADESALQNLFGTIFVEKVETVQTVNTISEINFNCVKVENEWKIKLDDESKNKLLNVISCNIFETVSSWGENFEEENTDGANFEDGYIWNNVYVGDEIELSTLKLCVIGSEELDQLTTEYYEPDIAKEGTKFVAITIEIENITKSTITLYDEFNLYDEQGREYKPYSEAYMYFEETFSFTDLAPNIKTTGTLVYNVPADSEGYYIVLGKEGTNEAYRLYAK